MLRERTMRVILVTALFVGVSVTIYLSSQTFLPQVFTLSYEREGQREEGVLPLRRLFRDREMEFKVAFDLPALRPSLYNLNFLGCIGDLEVNSVDILGKGEELCGDPLGHVLDFSSALRGGRNSVSLTLRKDGEFHEGFRWYILMMRPSRWDPVVLPFTLALLAVAVLYGVFLFRLVRPRRDLLAISAILLVGVLLRIVYVSATHYSDRSVDWQHHVQYIGYVAEHLQLPPAQLGWETYQPPLSYVLSALWVKVGTFFGRVPELLLQDLQMGALLVSVGVLVILYGLTWLLFSTKERREGWMFLGLLGASPSLLFFSARITNDVLFSLLGFLFLAVLILWWKRGDIWDFIIASGLIGFGLLTKSSALLWIPIVFLCVLFRRGMRWRQRLKHLASSLGIIVLLSGWLFVYRYDVEKETSVIGNVSQHIPMMFTSNALRDYLTFNPVRILMRPYNTSLAAEEGSQYFLEYLFRSLHFGPFTFGPRMIIYGLVLNFFGLLIMLLTIFGIVRTGRSYDVLPVFITLLVLFAGAVAYRWFLPTPTGQDIRLSIFLVVPLAYYAVMGFRHLPQYLKEAGQAVLASYILTSAAMPLLLFFYA